MDLPVFDNFPAWANYISRRLSRRKAYSLPMQMTTSTAVIPGAGSAPQSQQSVQVEDLEPGVYTVQFHVAGAPLATGGGPSFDCKATVTFKCNGQNVTRKLDVQQGVQISGPAEAINVVCQDTSVNGVDTDGASYTVLANISAGARGSFGSNPILGVFLNNLAQAVANAATETVQIPVGVGVISIKALVSPTPTAAADVTVDIQNAAGTSLMTYGLSQHTEFVPIPGDASQIVFTNNTGAGIKLSAQWGIDG